MENPIVAIICYNGYNVEDAILFNEASLKRGIFRTTYYNMYETHEETNRYKNNVVDSKITNIFNENIERTKPGYDYNYLDDNGLIKENVKIIPIITAPYEKYSFKRILKIIILIPHIGNA